MQKEEEEVKEEEKLKRNKKKVTCLKAYLSERKKEIKVYKRYAAAPSRRRSWKCLAAAGKLKGERCVSSVVKWWVKRKVVSLALLAVGLGLGLVSALRYPTVTQLTNASRQQRNVGIFFAFQESVEQNGKEKMG